MSRPGPKLEYDARPSLQFVAETEIAFGSHAGHSTVPVPALPADAITRTFLLVAYAIASASACDSLEPPKLKFIATTPKSAAARMALTIADVGQPRRPHTRCTYTRTCGAAPETPATPTVDPAIVP